MSDEASPPTYLTLGSDYASYRPDAEVPLADAVDMIDEAVRFCRENGHQLLFIDIRKLKGFPSPSTTDRFWLMKKWAESAGGDVVISMVAPPEIIDEEKIGVTMAANRGLVANIFAAESEAIEWLLRHVR